MMTSKDILDTDFQAKSLNKMLQETAHVKRRQVDKHSCNN